VVYEIIQALLASHDVSGIITDQIYPEEPPSEAVFPCLVYSWSESPAASADNAEIATAHTINFECYQRGTARPLADAVHTVMIEQGWVKVFIQSAGQVGPVNQVSSQYKTIKEV
jgi:DNA phosphorothioation-dependent restriction protein DptG